MSCPVLELTKNLVKIPSISPLDLGCQNIISHRLRSLGFKVENIKINKTNNIWAERGFGKTLTFLGHTDVVSPGNLTKWNTNPFDPVLVKKKLFGRGVADMKGAIAAMIVAVERFIFNYPKHTGRLSFIITSDEESTALDGTVKVVELLNSRKEIINYCLVGEPSSITVLGDTIKNGRRGSLTACLLINGIQGHIAYPHLADNPIHKSLPFLSDLQSFTWDKGNQYFSPTSMQIYKIEAGTEFNNIIPGHILIEFNFRFSPEITVDKIKKIVENILNFYYLDYSIEWFLSAKPFFTSKSKLINSTIYAIQEHTNIFPNLSTDGGTSDGRFLSEIGVEVVELGLINDSIHQVNEYVNIDDLKSLSIIYESIIKDLLLGDS
ncbi:Succinyl-diaminopimelate desuccinylase [Buchnera aphidicola (Eriosoma lanigerum)]|uniref:succinyl-diaminopimelate desuccinylase n=1 Tax=Buchnera aphidicola TaxID=9 RepID=UPI003463B106